jgi:hypothetical protein
MFSKRVFGNSYTFSTDVIQSGIQIEKFGESLKKWSNHNFISLSGIDIDLDSRLDVIALDENGLLHVFDHNLILLAGFPTLERFIPPILSGDILGDEYVEIIGKSQDSSSIIILDNKGNQLYNISSRKEDPLICLTNLNGHKSVISKSVVYNFDQYNEFNIQNSWSFEHGTQDRSRHVNLSMLDSSFSSQDILIRSYVYPNPIRENLGTIRVESYNAKSIEIKVYDLLGIQINSFKKDLIDCCSQINEWVWETSSFEPGVYFAHVSVVGENVEKNKIIKIAIL